MAEERIRFVPAPQPEPSAMDHILGQLARPDYTHAYSRDDVRSARAELAALRRERDDLELMLRASLCRHPSLRAIFQPRMSGEAYLLRDAKLSGREEDLIKLYDDGTGLPVLTDEARAALRAAERKTT